MAEYEVLVGPTERSEVVREAYRVGVEHHMRRGAGSVLALR